MTKLIRKQHSQKAGLPPGTLVHIGEKKTDSPRITLIDYDQQTFQETTLGKIEDCFKFKDSSTVTWINIDGLGDLELMTKLGERFGLHPLVLEDILNTNQRPKFEDFDDYIFVVLKMLTYDKTNESIVSEQVSVILGKNFVISFQESVGDVFEHVRERIRNGKGRIRKAGADYLAYSLLDAVVDGYFLIMENLGEKVELIQEQVVTNPTQKTLQKIHELKGEMISLRKSVWPLREVANNLPRSESDLIAPATSAYLRDVYDHTIQVIDNIETFREMASGMLDIYLSSISNKMNAVMKVLTIIATLFIPLTFVAGVYGMNFKHMPELEWRWGYAGVWAVMVAIAIVMLLYFRRKKWI